MSGQPTRHPHQWQQSGQLPAAGAEVEAEDPKPGVDKPEGPLQEAEVEVAVNVDPATLTCLPARPVICTGNLGNPPGGVVTATAVPGGTMRVQNHVTIEIFQ